MDELDDSLQGNAEQPEAETPAPEPAAEADAPEAVMDEEPKGPVRDEKGRFAPKGETESASPAPTEAPLDHAALIGERRRRQEAEDRIRALEEQFARLQQPQAAPQPTQGPPDRWEDPEGYDQWLVSQAAATAREEAIQAVNYQRIQAAAAQFRADKPDYQEVVAVFGQMANGNPGLIQQMQQAPNPAEFAYSTAKLQLEIQQHGSLDKLIEARVQDALAKATPAPAPAVTPIPNTLADAQSARGSTAAFAPPTLDDIIGRRG